MSQDSKKQVAKYAHVWVALKEASIGKIQYLTLEAPRSEHRNILNALRRESVKDRSFRAECIEKDKSFEIGFNQIGDMLQLYLRWKPYVTKSFVITPERIARMKLWP